MTITDSRGRIVAFTCHEYGALLAAAPALLAECDRLREVNAGLATALRMILADYDAGGCALLPSHRDAARAALGGK